MSDIKRRPKSGDKPDEGFESRGEHKQTRVTLTKDVSSKYRKILSDPRDKDGRRGGPGGRSLGYQGGEKPAYPRRKSVEGAEAPSRHRNEGIEEKPRRGRPPKSSEDGSSFGRRPSRPSRSSEERTFSDRRPPRSTEEGSSYGRRPQTSRDGSGPRRGASFTDKNPRGTRTGRPAFSTEKGRSGPAPSAELKVIRTRELPEAARQVKEPQDLLLSSANELLGLGESLNEIHQSVEAALNEFLSSWPQLRKDLEPLLANIELARKTGGALFEKISFQDLAGQRLDKVEYFCQTLERVLPELAGKGRTSRTGDFNKSRPAYDKPKAQDGRNRLKGPRAAGDRLDQPRINKLIGDEDG